MAKRKTKRYTASPRLNVIPILLSVLILVIASTVFVLSLGGLSDRPTHSRITQEKTTEKNEFIDRLVPVAKELHTEYGILPSIIIGQAILESDWGQSELSAKYNNLFGIKSFSPNDESVKLQTKEYKDGKWVDVNANFKVYASWEDCMRDHTFLFINGVDWDPYLYQGVLLADNYQTAANALQMAGYATDPNYAEKITDVIEKNKLYQYDK
ncbi:MAG: glycoside hydrolase family 73 protein [Vagococcus sp.]